MDLCASLESNICISNLALVRAYLWLSSTSDAEKCVRLYVGFPGSELSPSSSVKMLPVMSLADKCIVVGCFVCRDYDKILMETGKFSNNTWFIENGVVSGVNRVLNSSILRLEHRRST